MTISMPLATRRLEQAWRNEGQMNGQGIKGLKEFWNLGQIRGRIDIIDDANREDALGTSLALMVSAGDGRLVRIALQKQEALNLARAILSVI